MSYYECLICGWMAPGSGPNSCPVHGKRSILWSEETDDDVSECEDEDMDERGDE